MDHPPDHKLAILTREVGRDACKGSLFEFLRQGWHVLEPETEFVPGWHIEFVSEYLELVARGEVKQLIVNMPPKHTKSLLCTVFWPVWMWLQCEGRKTPSMRNPSLRFFFTSYSSTLSTEHSRS